MNVDEKSQRIEAATEARHSWIEAIQANAGHYFISIKWQVFVDLVHYADMDMYDFEEYLKKADPEEYQFAFTLPSIR